MAKEKVITPIEEEEEVTPTDEKVSILYDLCVLTKSIDGSHKDIESAVRQILDACKTQIEMDRKVRPLIMGRQTVTEFIKTYGEPNYATN